MEPKELTPEEQEARLRWMQDVLDGKDVLYPANGEEDARGAESAPEEPAPESEPDAEEPEDSAPDRSEPEWLADGRVDSALDELYADAAPAEEEEVSPEELRDNLNNFVRWLALAAAFVIFVCFGVTAIMYFDKVQRTTGQESASEEISEPVYRIRETSGVVTRVSGTLITVYNAVEGASEVIDLAGAKKMTDEYGLEIELEEVVVGSIVQIQINEGESVVELFRFTAQAEHLTCVTGLSFRQQPERTLPADEPDGEDPAPVDEPDGEDPAPADAPRTLRVNGSDYTYDDKLLLFYHGEVLAPEQLNEKMVVNVNALDGHIYTMDVLCGEGIIKLNSIPQDYFDTTLVLKPALGDEQSVVLTQDLRQISATEGVNAYRVETDEGEILAEGEIYVQGSGKSALLTLLPLEKHSGIVVFRINVKTAVIEIEGEPYANGAEILLPYGTYTAKVSAEGYRSADIEVTVGQPYCLVDVNINALRSQLILSSSYSGVVVRIMEMVSSDPNTGEPVWGRENSITLRGVSLTVPLEAGTYRIVAELEGYEPLELTVTLHANEADQVLFLTSFKKIIEPEPSEPESESEPEPESEEPSEPDSEEPSEEESGESSEDESGEPDSEEESETAAESAGESRSDTPEHSPVPTNGREKESKPDLAEEEN